MTVITPKVSEKDIEAFMSGFKLPQHELERASCSYFSQSVLYNFKDDMPFQVNKHHIAWDRAGTQHDRLLIQSHRDSGKSFYWSMAFPIWWLYFHPGDDIYIFSYSQEQANELLAEVGMQFKENPKLQWLIPKSAKLAWSKTVIETIHGKIVAKGFGTSSRGRHPKIIIVDDPLTDAQLYSAIERQRSKDLYYSAVTNMLKASMRSNKKAVKPKLVLVGTPFHEDDLYSDIKRNEAYECLIFKAITEDDNGNKISMWPERYPLEELMKRQQEIGSIRFSREFLCTPVSDESSMFPMELVAKGFDEVFVAPHMYDGNNKVVIGCDFALSSAIGADYSCFFTMMVDGAGNRYILDIFRKKGMSFKAQVAKIIELNARYRPDVINVETNQFQQIFYQTLIDISDAPVRAHVTTGKGKNSLETGVPGLRILFENGKVKIPRGDQRSIDMTDVFMRELAGFSWADGRLQGVGVHDDTVMAFWLANEANRAKSFDFEFV